VILGQRIRLYLNDVQSTFFERCAGTARFAFNWGLARWQARYDAGEKPSWVKLNGELNAVKAVEFPWMAELPWAVTNKALADLGTAFTHFFRRVKAGGPEPGYPRFKSKKRTTPAFAIEGRALQFDGKRVKIPKLGWVRTRQEVRLPGKILSTRFTKSAGHWYVSIQTEVAESWIYPHRCETQAAVGVDLGVRDLAVLSTALSTGSSPEHTTVERTNSRRKPGERDGNGLLARRMAFWHSWLCVQVTSLWTRPDVPTASHGRNPQ